MFVEHQSTSGTKIHPMDSSTRAVLLNYAYTEITVGVVIIRDSFILFYFGSESGNLSMITS